MYITYKNDIVGFSKYKREGVIQIILLLSIFFSFCLKEKYIMKYFTELKTCNYTQARLEFWQTHVNATCAFPVSSVRD